MRDKIYYYDHNDVLQLTLNEYPYYSEPSEFKNWVWGYNTQYGKINTFHRNKEEWPLFIGIASDYLPAHDELCDIFTADVMAEKPGKLVLRDWTLKCYITQAEYSYGTYRTELDRSAEFVVRAIDSTWYRERMHSYDGSAPGGGDEDLWRDYVDLGEGGRRGYNYGYNKPAQHQDEITLTGGGGHGYEITIYGPAEDPSIYVNGHPIQVFITLDNGERLRIVSNGGIKTIEKISTTGITENVFAYRNKQYSPFIDLPEIVELSWGDIKFDLKTIERRSEPTWI